MIQHPDQIKILFSPRSLTGGFFVLLQQLQNTKAMVPEYFLHPGRFPKNPPGPFYTTGHQAPATNEKGAPLVWCGDCLWCGAPEDEAPDLLSPLTDNDFDTYFVKQPCTIEEIARACMAARVCCVNAVRYGGMDPSIIGRLENNPEWCDFIIAHDGKLQRTIDDKGELLPFAKTIVAIREATWKRQQNRQRRWWEFWK